MKNSNILIALCAVFVLTLAVQASAAQIEFRLAVMDTADVELVPSGSGAYILPVGSDFKVGLFATVLSPNMTDTLRTGTTMDNKPLGMSLVNTNLLGVGAVGPAGVEPVRDATVTQPPLAWDPNFITSTMLANFPALPITVGDLNADGVLDVNGAGFAQLSLTLASAGTLPNFQEGAVGEVMVYSGLYHVNTAAPTTIGLQVLNASVFSDPAGGTTGLASVDLFGSDLILPAPLAFGEVPEPASIGLLAIGLAGLLSRRRA